MSKRILVVGSINVDYVIHTPRLPRLGETLTGDSFAMNFGGKGANQAIAIAKAGCEVKMLGAVGNDLSGELAINNLRACGVDADEVLRVDAPTGAAMITVCGGDNHIILDVGANAFVTPAWIERRREVFLWADIVVMQYEIPVDSVLAAARLASSLGKTVVLNPAPVKEVSPALYPFVDLIVPNEFEAELITGIKPQDAASARGAIDALRRMGCKNAIITLGAQGSAFGMGEEIAFAGVYDVRAVDTTAAGDSFIGGICSKLCEGQSLDRAVLYASAVSAIAVSRAGAAVSIPNAEEVEAFIASHSIKPSVF